MLAVNDQARQGIFVSASIVVLSWVFLDDLAPVPYVEQILYLVAELGLVWLMLGIISLLLILFPFFSMVGKI